jgi:hypothetical protein
LDHRGINLVCPVFYSIVLCFSASSIVVLVIEGTRTIQVANRQKEDGIEYDESIDKAIQACWPFSLAYYMSFRDSPRSNWLRFVVLGPGNEPAGLLI